MFLTTTGIVSDLSPIAGDAFDLSPVAFEVTDDITLTDGLYWYDQNAVGSILDLNFILDQSELDGGIPGSNLDTDFTLDESELY